ncbi:MAG: type II secretion system GspH family protein [Lachnospiraceae bacterium]|nr:type II secretion system GspH family protein [Lachnospiraceae bacterium]
MRNYINNLKNNKKGFSLVELIIVIAIMAILVGIVASQVIPYLEKSRKGKDQQQLSGITTAIVSTIADHATAIETITASDIEGWDSAAGTSAMTDTNCDKEFVSNLSSLLSTSGDVEDLTDIMKAVAGKFKSKAYTDVTGTGSNIDGKNIKGMLASGKTTVFVATGTTPNADEKLKSESD